MTEISQEDDLPICPKCGNVMQLADLRPRFQAVGIVIEEKDLPFRIQCCDLQLRMENDDERRRAIKALQAFYGANEGDNGNQP